MSVHATDINAGDLVRRCVAGDDSARAEFISLYDGLIRRAIARRVGRTAAARSNAAHIDDIAHEVYVRLFANQCRALNSLRNAERLNSWLVTVSQNQAVGYLRRIGSVIQDEDGFNDMPAPDEHTPDARAMRNESIRRLGECMAQLDPKDRLVLQLFYLYDLRYADIGHTLNMNINTVASRLLRAKQRLREMLGDELR
jgi:RNA polymerase sigma-70 factor (ECF subfamily)